jgi:hypothetical protein
MDKSDRYLVAAGIAILALLAIALLSACGSAAQQHRALNALAETADPSYELAITACDEAEGVIIARAGTTYEQDRQAIDEIRVTCDRIFGAFDTLRLAHRSARAAVDGGASALIDEALRSLAEAWSAAQRVLPELAGLGPPR